MKCFALVAITVGEAPAPCQVPTEAAAVDVRQRFHYESAGRVDPFRPPVDEGGITGRFGDLELRGIIEHEQSSRSVAVLTQRGTSWRVRAAVGQRVGDMRIVSIGDGRVEVIVEELGVSRRETITMRPSEVGVGRESRR